MDISVRSDSPERTRRIAAGLASVLHPGDVVLLIGDLGAGKTCFVQGAAAELGVGARVTSPTFILSRTYPGRVPVTHVDAYRLSSLSELEDLDLDMAAAVTFVEWGDAVREAIGDHLSVEIERDGDAARTLRVRAFGPSWAGRDLAAALEAAR